MIKEEVREGHLARFPDEIDILKKIEADFDITWASRITKFSTDVSVYFIKPKPHISQAFGFEQELILALSDYPKLEVSSFKPSSKCFSNCPPKEKSTRLSQS